MSIMPSRFQLGVDMRRAIAVLVFIIALSLFSVLGTRWLQSEDSQAVIASLPTCDLLAGPCEWQMEAGRWQVALEMLGDEGQGKEYLLTVHTPATPNRFLAVLRGESMYMGEYPVPLRQQESGIYTAHFTAPLCTTGADMVWRIDLQEGQNQLTDSVPLKLVFQAQNR